MTTQDLTNNRNEIIAYLNENAGDVKLAMTKMIIFASDYEANDWERLADYVIETYNLEIALFHKNKLWGHGCKYSTQAEYQRAQLGSKFN